MLRTLNLAIVFGLLLFSNAVNAQSLEAFKKVSDNFYYAGKYDSAMFYAKKAEAVLRKDSSENSGAYAYFIGQYFAMICENLGDVHKSTFWYKESLQLFEKLNDTASNHYAETLANYGNLLNNIGSYSEALSYLQKAATILRKYKKQLDLYSSTLNNPEKDAATLDDYKEQLDLYGATMNNLANAYIYIGSFAKAEAIYIDLLNLVKKVLKSEENMYSAKLYSNLGVVYNRTGLWERSGRVLLKGGSINRKVNGDKREYYTAMLNLGESYAALKKTAACQQVFREILDSISPAESVVLHASALNGLGEVMQQQHNWKESEAYYLAALKELRQDETGGRIYNSVGYNLASLYAQNKSPKADSLFRLLIKDYELTQNKNHFNYLQTFSGFCGNLIQNNYVTEASDSLRSLSKHLFKIINRNYEGMPQYEKLRFAEILKINFDLVYSLLSSGKAGGELTRLGLYNLLQLKGMILTNQTELYNEVRHSSDTALSAAYSNWLKTQQILYASYSLPLKKRTFNTDSLEGLAEDYERKFSVTGSVTMPANKEMLIEKIRKTLLPGQAAIEFVRFNSVSTTNNQAMYGAFILKPEQAEPVFVRLCSEQQLKQLFNPQKGVKANANKLINKIYQAGNLSLYTLLWKPMEQHLKNITSIFYAPAGTINSIALNAISTGKSKLLIDSFNLYLLSGIRDLADNAVKKSKMPAAASIWGKMDYSESIYLNQHSLTEDRVNTSADKSILPDGVTKGGRFSKHWNELSDEETKAVSNLFLAKKIPVTTYGNQEATEEKFKSKAAGLQGILHISTHGFFAPADTNNPGIMSTNNMFTAHVNPLLRCGLIFSGANYISAGKEPLPGKDDGILTGYEIAQLDLSKIDLVVLSACETGLGDINAGDEGVMGLRRAFKLAGAKKLMVSLWQVPVVKTTELMTLFYQKLLNGQTPSKALLQAQKHMREKNYPPFFWAGFVLIE